MTLNQWFLGGASLVALASVPAVSRAQVMIAVPMNGSMTMSTGDDASDGGAKKSGPISADSLTALKKFVSTKQPLIMIDEKLSSAKAFAALKVAQIGGVKLAEATDGDLKYYGDKAKNGILQITTASTSTAKKGDPNGRTVTLPDGRTIVISGGTATGTFTISPGP